MKFALFVLLAAFFMASCQNRVIPFKGTYAEQPYTFSAAVDKATALQRIASFATTQKLAIQLMDVPTGVVTTAQASLLDVCTWEDKNGVLVHPNAAVVCSRVRGPFTFGNTLRPTRVDGQWSIIVSEQDKGVSVKISLLNASGELVIDEQPNNATRSVKEVHSLKVKSTGVLEKALEATLRPTNP